MRILIGGICGFVGSSLARLLPEHMAGLAVCGFDNLLRPGAEFNRRALKDAGVDVWHGDVRCWSDLESLPPADWIVDAAAWPSVLAGMAGNLDSRRLVEHNLIGTLHLLELARRWQCGFILLSTSRVYSIADLAALPLETSAQRFQLAQAALAKNGVLPTGISELFPTNTPISLYGASKLAGEVMALEYGAAYQLPVIVNRCGVLAGAGQFGRADQGIFAYWIHACREKRPLRYIGFGGQGLQVRDCLHPRDLAALLMRQMDKPSAGAHRAYNVSGGLENSVSLAELDAWCTRRFGPHAVASQPENRPFDVPWLVLDSTHAQQTWSWRPELALTAIFEEIAVYADQHPQWLAMTS